MLVFRGNLLQMLKNLGFFLSLSLSFLFLFLFLFLWGGGKGEGSGELRLCKVI